MEIEKMKSGRKREKEKEIEKKTEKQREDERDRERKKGSESKGRDRKKGKRRENEKMRNKKKRLTRKREKGRESERKTKRQKWVTKTQDVQIVAQNNESTMIRLKKWYLVGCTLHSVWVGNPFMICACWNLPKSNSTLGVFHIYGMASRTIHHV